MAGLSLARQMAMVSYRSAQGYDAKLGRQVHEPSGQWQVQRYLTHQVCTFHHAYGWRLAVERLSL
jgi:homoserine acetyltransferase